MVLSTIVGSIGTGLLCTIGLETSTVRWAAYMVITGMGIGIGVQLPYTAVQVISMYVRYQFNSSQLALMLSTVKETCLLPMVSVCVAYNEVSAC